MPSLRRLTEPLPCRPLSPAESLAIVVWLVVLAAILGVPYLIHSSTLEDDLIRNTVRLSLAYYAAAVSLMLLLRPSAWAAVSGLGRLARLCWTLAWAAFLVHLVMAFHHYHHWSHADAVEHTRQVSGVGEGIYLSHLFSLVWTADVLLWWWRPDWYAGRSPWIDRLLHAFMVFIIFNGTIVYEDGPIRWAGIALFAELAVLGLVRLTRQTRGRPGLSRECAINQISTPGK